MNEVRIVGYSERYADDFKRISYEWLNDYSILEDVDVEMIENFRDVILKNHGDMFFAKVGDEIAGTLSLMKLSDGVYELVKFGVTKKYRGQGVGRVLLQYVIDFATKKGYKKLIVHTMSILKPSIHLYKNMKFNQVTVEESGEKCVFELTDLTFYRMLD